MSVFHAKPLAEAMDAVAPDGSEVRLLAQVEHGGMAHFRLNPGQISRAVTHRTVEEIWYVVNGRGQMWRSQGGREEIIELHAGLSLTVPLGTHFQFRAAPNDSLDIVGVTMPPWPGAGEARVVPGVWKSNIHQPEAASSFILKSDVDRVHVDSPYCGEVVEILRGGEFSPNVAVLTDVRATRGHFHNGFDEIYFVLDGAIALRLYDSQADALHEVQLGALDLCVIPRGLHHQITAASDRNRLCVLCTPAFDAEDEHLSDALLKAPPAGVMSFVRS